MVSISTCWNSQRHTDGEAMLRELLSLGFDTVELGHGIRVSLLPGIRRMVEAGEVCISSLHNFCPLPLEITWPAPDCLQFTSYREAERERAVRQTLATIDLAAELGAGFVVLHGGSVVMKPITEPLLTLAGEGERYSAGYARAKLEAVIRRERIAPRYLARLEAALEAIVPHAAARGVRLGLEGRHSYEEMPSEREFPALLERFAPTLGYWHDFGHLQVKANLGFVDHAEWLASVAPRLFGAHLHDVRWPGRDHLPPFRGGGVDYERLVPFLPADGPLVWEISSRRSADEISLSLRQWKERFGA